MENCRKINRTREESNQLKIYKDVYKICNETLCAKTDEGFQLKTCINRNCNDCGVSKFYTDPDETSVNSDSLDVSWKCFEYNDFNCVFCHLALNIWDGNLSNNFKK
jgi:hypothetical protein